MSSLLAKEVREPVQKAYSRMDYYQFCEYLGLNPEYDQLYWEAFHKLSDGLAIFDNEQLQKLLDYGQ